MRLLTPIPSSFQLLPPAPQHTHPLSYTLVDLRISVTASFGAYMNKGKGCGEGGKQCPVLSI